MKRINQRQDTISKTIAKCLVRLRREERLAWMGVGRSGGTGGVDVGIIDGKFMVTKARVCRLT